MELTDWMYESSSTTHCRCLFGAGSTVGETSSPTTNFGPLVIHQFLGGRLSSPRRLPIAPNPTTGLSLPKSKRHGNQLRRFTVRAPANVQRFHSLPNDAAQALFCTLCARWVGTVVRRLGGENTPRRSSAR